MLNQTDIRVIQQELSRALKVDTQEEVDRRRRLAVASYLALLAEEVREGEVCGFDLQWHDGSLEIGISRQLHSPANLIETRIHMMGDRKGGVGGGGV